MVTGDVTDRGTSASWRGSSTWWRQARLNDRVVLVPGNHDLAFIDPWHGVFAIRRGSWRRNDRFGLVQLANLLKFCEAFAATGGGRRGWVLRNGQPVRYVEAWREVEQAVRPLVAALPARWRCRGGGWAAALWPRREALRRVRGADRAARASGCWRCSRWRCRCPARTRCCSC